MLDYLSLGYVVCEAQQGEVMDYFSSRFLVHCVQKQFSKSPQLCGCCLALFMQSKVVLSKVLNLFLEHSLVLLLLWRIITKHVVTNNYLEVNAANSTCSAMLRIC